MAISKKIIESIENDDNIDEDFKKMIIKFLELQEDALNVDGNIENAIKNQLETNYGLNDDLVEWCKNYE